MKFDTIRLVGDTNVDLPLAGADPAGPFILKGVDGLGAPEREVRKKRTVYEGGFRQGTFAVDRQIVARVGLQPDWDTGQTADELREMLYGAYVVPFGQPLTLQLIKAGVVIAVAKGDISRLEPVLFSKDPEVQLTMECDYPYLLAPSLKYQIPSKESVATGTAIDIANDGTAPAGFWLNIALRSSFSGSIKISENSPNGRVMEIKGPWAAGDILLVDTRPGSRRIVKTPAGSTTAGSILGKLTGASPWLMLHKGPNRLIISGVEDFDFQGNGFAHTTAYLGV